MEVLRWTETREKEPRVMFENPREVLLVEGHTDAIVKAITLPSRTDAPSRWRLP